MYKNIKKSAKSGKYVQKGLTCKNSKNCQEKQKKRQKQTKMDTELPVTNFQYQDITKVKNSGY